MDVLKPATDRNAVTMQYPHPPPATHVPGPWIPGSRPRVLRPIPVSLTFRLGPRRTGHV